MTIAQITEYLKNMVIGSERYQDRINRSGEYFLISAVLDKRNRIISIGENSLTKTHPMMAHYVNKTKSNHKIYLHAEISALVRAYNKGYAMIVIRVNRQGTLAMSKPCPICEMAIKEAEIKKVYYSTREGEMEVLNYD